MLKIRPFLKGQDEEIYVRIYNAGFADYDDLRSVTIEEARTVEKAPSHNLDGLLIAEWNGQPIGMVQALVDKFREEKKGFIQSLAVLPEYRHRGIARQLVAKAIESLKERGMELADAWAQMDRQACAHLFESFGFKSIRLTSLMRASLSSNLSDTEGNKDVSLREMTMTNHEDILLLNMLDNEAFKEHFNYRPVTVEETMYMVQEMPWFQHQKVWFAVSDGQPVGYAVSGIDVGLNKEKSVKYGWVLDIGVVKSHRRKRIGVSLMLTAMEYLKSLGMGDALLYVDDMNPTNAMKLYEKVGFKVFHKSSIYELKLS